MGAARRIRQRMRRVVQRVGNRGQPAETINVSDPTNVVVSGGLGDSGAVHGTSTRQTVRVRQDGEETVEETHTSETRIR